MTDASSYAVWRKAHPRRRGWNQITGRARPLLPPRRQCHPLIAYSLAYDKFKQALNLVHRMNSVKPVNVYVILCQGSIDRKLESLIQEKSDAAELVLDGQLIGERSEEVTLAELLSGVCLVFLLSLPPLISKHFRGIQR
jgi:hypothetical protein